MDRGILSERPMGQAIELPFRGDLTLFARYPRALLRGHGEDFPVRLSAKYVLRSSAKVSGPHEADQFTRFFAGGGWPAGGDFDDPRNRRQARGSSPRRGTAPLLYLPRDSTSAQAAGDLRNGADPTIRPDVVEKLNADPPARGWIRAAAFSDGATFTLSGDFLRRRGMAATTGNSSGDRGVRPAAK